MAGESHKQRTLREYSTFTWSLNFINIVRPVVNAANMEMELALISQVILWKAMHSLGHIFENLQYGQD